MLPDDHFADHDVVSAFLLLLSREPSPAELSERTAQLKGGRSLRALIEEIISSSEFRQSNDAVELNDGLIPTYFLDKRIDPMLQVMLRRANDLRQIVAEAPLPDPIPETLPDPVPEPLPDPIPDSTPDLIPDPIPASAPPVSLESTSIVARSLTTDIVASKLFSYIRPRQIKSAGLVRIGGQHDGGYVMADILGDADAAVSLGIGPDVSWDIAIANRGIPVWQYDHTVDAPEQCSGPSYQFFQSKVVPGRSANKPHELGILDILETDGLRDKRRLILKIDIEGDEWEVLNSITSEHFDRVQQISIEFHDINLATNNDWATKSLQALAKLTRQFTPVHLHGNNNASFCQLGGRAVPTVLEVCFVRTAEHEFGASIEHFPASDLDEPNNADLADLTFSI